MLKTVLESNSCLILAFRFTHPAETRTVGLGEPSRRPRRRDPGSGQAQLNEADLQQLLGSGVMIDGFFLKESERQKGDGSFTFL